VNDKHAPIRGVAFASDKTALFQVVNNHGDIAAASQYFPAKIPLGEGTEVENRFKHTELADG
jgi:hypothetical protein